MVRSGRVRNVTSVMSMACSTRSPCATATADITWCVRPSSRCSIATASSGERGFPNTSSARSTTAVSAASTTAVVLRAEEVFGKPRSPEEAVAMLQRLEGRTHQVMSAVAVAQGERVEHAIDITDVTFRTLPERTIADYVATGEALDKAGAYAVQGRGAALVEGIRGDFFGVMGLPLRLALELLERFGMPYRFTR